MTTSPNPIWPNRHLLDLLGIELPIIQAPMAASATPALAIAVGQAGGLGSLPGAMSAPDQLRSDLRAVRQGMAKPINLNFFCHAPAPTDPAREAAWRQRLRPYYLELGLDPEMPGPGLALAPFGAAQCDLVEELRPEIVSFHFGLPGHELLSRVKAAGAKVLSSATTLEEALWLERRGCDAIIAQGTEAGGHRGMFLSADMGTQVATMALLSQLARKVNVPIIAAGGIVDGRGIAAAFALGAAAVQIGAAYLLCPETVVAQLHRKALKTQRSDQTALTNVFTGRPARVIVNRIVRELGGMAREAPAFPVAAAALAPLRARAEAAGSDDFTPLWAGQGAGPGRELPAGELTRQLADETLATLRNRPDGRHPR